MCAASRWATSLIYVLSIGTTLFVCFFPAIVCPESRRKCEGEETCDLNSEKSGCEQPDTCTFTKCDPQPWAVPLIVACVVIQCLALIYYILSYIPYGRTLFTKCMKRTCSKCV
jgi:hypothetical protein